MCEKAYISVGMASQENHDEKKIKKKKTMMKFKKYINSLNHKCMIKQIRICFINHPGCILFCIRTSFVVIVVVAVFNF